MSTSDALVAAMDRHGITDPVMRNGIMAIAAHEGGLGELRPEMGYSRTGNARIRQIFGSRVSALSDAQLNHLKADDKRFFNYVYNGSNSVGKQLGNVPNTDDGYDFRGRGFIQLTGRYNYTRYANMIQRQDILNNLELADDPQVSAELTVAYIKDRYKGGGFDQLMACVGNNPVESAARKRTTFAEYSRDHRYG